MKLNKLNLFNLFSVVLAALCLCACSNDEPKDSGENPKPEPPAVMTEAEIVQILQGSWISIDESGKWIRVEFSLNEDGLGSYRWLECKDATLTTPLEVSLGSCRVVMEGTPLTPAVLLDHTVESNEVSLYYLFPTDIGEHEISLKASGDLMDTAENCEAEEVRFHRVLASYFGELGDDFPFVTAGNMVDKEYSCEASLDSEVATYDEVSSMVSVNGYGTTYIPIKFEEETAYIEVTGSPITEMPYPFEDVLGVGGRETTDENAQTVILWDKSLDPLKEKYKGIMSIGYQIGDLTNTIRYISDIWVRLDSNVNEYAKWLLACKIGEPYRYETKYVFGVVFKIPFNTVVDNQSEELLINASRGTLDYSYIYDWY